MVERKPQSLLSKVKNLKVGSKMTVSSIRSKGGYDQCHIRKCVMFARQSGGSYEYTKDLDDFIITRTK